MSFDWANAGAEPPVNLWHEPGAEKNTAFPQIPPSPCKIALWRGASERGSAGVVAAEGWVAYALYEVPAVPDFSSPRFPDLSQLDEAQRIQRVGQLQAQLVSALHPLGDTVSFSLRYWYRGEPGQEGRIRPFLVGRAFGPTQSDALAGIGAFRDTVLRAFPAEYRLEEWGARDPGLTGAVLSPGNVAGIAEILKPEQALSAWHETDVCGFSFWYWPQALQAAETDVTALCRSLCAGGAGDVLVDITLVPALPLSLAEREEITTWGMLAEKWGRDQRLQVPGGLYSAPKTAEIAADPQAQEAKKAYADILSRYGSPSARLFLWSARVLWSGDAAPAADRAAVLANGLASQALAPGSAHQLSVMDQTHPAFSRALAAVRGCYVTPAVCNGTLWGHPEAPETLRRLHRLGDMKELSGLFRLPIPGRDGCPGIPLDPGLPQSAPGRALAPRGIRIGRFVEGSRVMAEEAAFALQDLAKHALVVGTPGSGKTTLCFSLLAQLWNEHRIPFLVLEPAKTEYRALLDVPGLGDDLLVFTPGTERVSPFRFNPFEVLPGVSVSERISTLNACFSGAFSLSDPLPMILDEGIRDAYAQKGWSEYAAGGDDPGLEPPTMADLLSSALAVAERSSYKGELAGNIRGAIETRLGSLMRGPKGRCFNTRLSVPASVLMTRPVVIELDALSDDEKALLMMFVLAMVREYARTTRRSGARLSHVVLVEEAHNVIGRGDGQGSDARANPKQVAIRFFTRMLAEMRALGEGVVIADQLPTAIAPEAVKNTNIKVMHRVVSAEDRQELGQAMVFDPAQLELAATLPPGNSLVFMEGWSRSRHVVEPDFKREFGVGEPPTDAELAARMAPALSGDDLRAAYVPYQGCGAVCRRCDGRVREQTERWVERKLPLVRAEREKRPKDDSNAVAFEEYVSGFEAPPDDMVRWHCASVHFLERIAVKGSV